METQEFQRGSEGGCYFSSVVENASGSQTGTATKSLEVATLMHVAREGFWMPKTDSWVATRSD